jgi:hypothetical protein
MLALQECDLSEDFDHLSVECLEVDKLFESMYESSNIKIIVTLVCWTQELVYDSKLANTMTTCRVVMRESFLWRRVKC